MSIIYAFVTKHDIAISAYLDENKINCDKEELLCILHIASDSQKNITFAQLTHGCTGVQRKHFLDIA